MCLLPKHIFLPLALICGPEDVLCGTTKEIVLSVFFCATHHHTLKAESFDINELIINIIYDIKTKHIQLQIGKV